MDIAIVTGASGGVGLAVARKLVELGYRVYGLGGNYQDLSYTHTDFRGVPCDLTNPSDLVEQTERILREEGNISVLVNNAKFFTFKSFEESQPADFDTTLTVNLLCPLILARVALPSLAKLGGHIINIAPHSVDQSRGGPSAAAAAGGLDWLGESLFEELRDHGVRVSTLYPQANRSKPEGPPPGAKNPTRAQINVEAIAEALEAILSARHGNFFSRVVLRPERTREQPIPPVLRVPMPKSLEDYPRIKEPPTEEELAENASRRHRDTERTRQEERRRRRAEEERVYRERLAGNAQLAREERDDPDAAPLPSSEIYDEQEDDLDSDPSEEAGEDRVNLDARPAPEPERRGHREPRQGREQRPPREQREPRPPREQRQRQGQQNQQPRPPQENAPATAAPEGQPAPVENQSPAPETASAPEAASVSPAASPAEGQPAPVEENKPKKLDLQEMIREQIRLRKEREAAAAAAASGETPAPAETPAPEAAPAPAAPAETTPTGETASPEPDAQPTAPKKVDLREILREKMRQKRAAEAAEAAASTEPEETKAETEVEELSVSEEASKALPPSPDATSSAATPPSSASTAPAGTHFAPAAGAKTHFAPGGTGGSFRPAGGLGAPVRSGLGALQNRLRRGSLRHAAPTPTPTPAPAVTAPPPAPEVRDPAPQPVVETPAPAVEAPAATPAPAEVQPAEPAPSAPRKAARKPAPRKAARRPAPRKAAEGQQDASPAGSPGSEG